MADDQLIGFTGNMVRARVKIRGTRALLQHEFGPDAIPLEAREKTGVAGNDPEEWKRTCMVTPEGVLYLKPTNVFSSVRGGARHTKKGRGNYLDLVAATLQVEEDIILLNRRMPEGGDPPRDLTAPVYLDVQGVRNPSTKARNVRYRLAASKGWECEFTLFWDRTIVPREVMKAVLRDTGVLVGIGDGRNIGFGRFVVVAYQELQGEGDGAEEEAAEGGVGEAPPDRVAPGRKKVRKVSTAGEVDGVPH